MLDLSKLIISEYTYHLPSDRIAQFPLADRDASKLLIYRNGQICQDLFSNIDLFLPDNSLLIFNDTKVIHARLLFVKQSGATIEIFCLEPLSPVSEIHAAFQQQHRSTWKCLVGNMKRWKSGILRMDYYFEGKPYSLTALRTGDLSEGCHAVEFSWDPPEQTFSQVLKSIGKVPLPPYIRRQANESDSLRYQTIYAENEGSVAAPTAGLHFTDEILNKLALKQYCFEKVTLHVGIGTFRPITSLVVTDHIMHKEKIVVKRKTIESLYDNPDRPVIAVGTTSARTIESLYWLGVGLLDRKKMPFPEVGQWDPYQQSNHSTIPVKKALESLLEFLSGNELDEYSGETQLMIIPSYTYKIVKGLITNFHMPQSSLLLLVAALIGEDWRKAYQFAIEQDFRFLSYGDSSLFLKMSDK